MITKGRAVVKVLEEATKEQHCVRDTVGVPHGGGCQWAPAGGCLKKLKIQGWTEIWRCSFLVCGGGIREQLA